MNEITTTNLSRFGYREIAMAARLLNEWTSNGLPKTFHNDEVAIMMNYNSGDVFLINSEYQVAMMNGEVLEEFYTDPETGEEGFLKDLSDKAKVNIGLV